MNKIKKWEDIKVWQFMELQNIKTGDELDITERAICLLYEMTEKEVEELPMPIFNQYAKEIGNLLTTDISCLNTNPKKIIKGKKGKYKVIYDPRKLTHRQFVEIQYFSSEMMHNIHFIMASLVRPIKFFRTIKNTAEMHTSIAEDLLEAKIIDVYGSCVFFCNLYLNSLKSIRAYLENQMMNQGATKNQAAELLNNLINVTAGFTTQKKLQNTNVLH